MDKKKVLDKFCDKIAESLKYKYIQIMSFSISELEEVYSAIIEMENELEEKDENNENDSELIVDGGSF